MFFNLFAPSTVGGDVTRVYYLVKDEEAQAKGRAVTTVHAAMSVLMDRAIGMVVLVWLGALGAAAVSELRGATGRPHRDFFARARAAGGRLAYARAQAVSAGGRPSSRRQITSGFEELSAALARAPGGGAAFTDGPSDSSMDAYGDGARPGSGSAFFLLSDCLSAGRNVLRRFRSA